MKVFVVVVAYNFERWMERNLNNLQKSTVPVQVVVVDNASTDDTVRLLEQKYPEVIRIKNNSNVGFGKANNMGIQYALEQGGDFVFLLNQDAWIDPNVVETLLAVFKKHPQFGILSPVHLNGDGNELDHGFSIYSKLKNKEALQEKYPKSTDVVEANIINAAFWMIPKTIVQAIGGFSPVFYHCGEDIDYLNRLHYHGYKVGYCPHVFGYHDRADRKPGKENFLFHLTEYTNIQYSFPKAFSHSILAELKIIATHLFEKRGYQEARRLLPITFKHLLNSRNILQSRKAAKNKRQCFL